MDVTLVVDLEGVIVFASRSASSLFGETPAKLLGASVFSLMPARIRDGQRTLWSMAKGPTEPMCLEAVGLREGKEFPLLLEVSLISHSTTTRMYCVAVYENSPNSAEAKHAQQMQSLGLLASGVAHDFNNSLNTIMSLAQVVRDELSHNDSVQKDIKEILTTASNAGALTHQLLSFAKQRPTKATAIELNRSVSEIDKILRRTLPSTIQLKFESLHTKLQVLFPPSDLHHILINLATNAKDAMPGGGTLHITLDRCKVKDTEALAAGDYATLAIRDTGIGIAYEALPKIFEPFYSTKGDAGTGLGLSTSFGLAMQSGGALKVSSELGVGTMFTLFMPITNVEAVQPATTTEGTRIRSHQGVALIVEDESTLRKYMKRTVVKSGLTTLVASSAEEALRLASSLVVPPELLVSDIVLPGESGTDLAVKLHDSFPDLKILLTSGRVDGINDPAAVQKTDALFLPKPFTAKQLRKHIELLMNPPSRRLEGTILLIEPDAQEIEDTSATFKELGFSTVAMADGAAAKAYLASVESPPALILLSLNLPDHTAQNILESVRSGELTSETPIVLLESESKKYTHKCGNHTSVLSLPLTDAKLNRALERVGLTIS